MKQWISQSHLLTDGSIRKMSKKHIEILNERAKGKSIKEIAYDRKRSIKTIECFWGLIVVHMGVGNDPIAVIREAERRGIITTTKPQIKQPTLSHKSTLDLIQFFYNQEILKQLWYHV